ncbi:MAG: hypothetical protein CMJ46_10895 [Planctomyces sp.]|nr:hypothetical protein [Planctomyces sp.]
MYVAEMVGYPASAGLGRIKRLTDEDGDGFYENVTLFAEGLDFPNSVMPFRDGILVAAAPDILYLVDTNGDGQADQRDVIWTGFNAGSQQLRANALHRGIDNWIYGANGRNDGLVHRPGNETNTVSIRGRDFRFAPDFTQFESIAGQSQFGQAHDDWGNRFLSWNTIPVRQIVYPDWYLQQFPELVPAAVHDCTSPDDLGEVFPLSPPPQQFNGERANYYNAMCGLTIYRGNRLGKAYDNDAFICESLTNLVTRRKFDRSKPAFVASRPEQGEEFLASEDPWFHPVFTATGPDGALYVVDFYRELVEHPLYVASPALKEQIDWRRGFNHGRIWRIHHKENSRLAERPGISASSLETNELVARLEHPVSWQRETAQRLLVERQQRNAALLLRELINRSTNPLARAHALWTLNGIHARSEEDVTRALDDVSPQVQTQALQLAVPFLPQSRILTSKIASLVNESAAELQFPLSMVLARLNPEEARPLLVKLLHESSSNQFVAETVLTSAGEQTGIVLRELFTAHPEWNSNPDSHQIGRLLFAGEKLSDEYEKHLQELLDVLEGKDVTENPGTAIVLMGVSAGVAKAGAVAPLRFTEHQEALDAMTAHCQRILADESQSISLRLAAIRYLQLSRDNVVADYLMETLDQVAPRELKEAIVEALFAMGSSSHAHKLFDGWNQKSPEMRRMIVNKAAVNASGASALFDALRGEQVEILEVPLTVQAQLDTLLSPAQKEDLAAILNRHANSDRQKVIAEYTHVLSMTGDLERGAAVFRKQCLTCHTIQRYGKQIGPDLTGISARPAEVILADVLDPSARVSADFVSYTVLTTRGTVLTGLLINESDEGITLKTSEDKLVTVAADEVEELKVSGKSLMPEGLEKQLPPHEMADLLEFLRQPRKSLLEAAE